MLKRSHLNEVNIDTTVQEKAIAFPTDARLFQKMRERLVKEAKARGIKLRQSYKRLGKKALVKQIGHLKEDNRMSRNHLKGKEGDRINALLRGCGANMRKLLMAFSFVLFILKKCLGESIRFARWSITYRPYLARLA